MKTVLKLMVRHGYITQEEADIANSIDVSSLLSGVSEENSYQGYVDTVVEEVEKKTGNSPYLVSMEIHTAMVPDIQDGINKVMNGNGYTWKDDKVQAGITIVDVNSGAISAIGAGRNRQGELTYNYATMAKRQPGSTAKPIFAYGPGFEYDNFSTYQLFNDEAWSYSDGTEFGNWDSGYKGLMTLREALSVSRNVPAIKALQTVNKDVGNSKIVQFVENLGIDLDKDVAYESYAIGGLDEGVTTVQMAGAYAAFANGGYYIEPYTVKSITYRSSGKTKKFESKKTRAMKDSTAYMITNVLEYARC
jgi:penicillin-binding protein 1A